MSKNKKKEIIEGWLKEARELRSCLKYDSPDILMATDSRIKTLTDVLRLLNAK